MKNFSILFFLMICIQGNSQSPDNFRTVNPVNFESVRSLNEINDDNLADAYPWISSDGLRIYYTKEYSDGQELVFTERENYDSDFSAPVIVPTGNIRPTSCWLSANELTAYVTEINHLYFLKRSSRNSDFEPPVEIHLDGAPSYTFLTRASLDLSQNELFISIDAVGMKRLNMAQFKRTSESSFSFEKYIYLPFDFIPVLGQLSKDGRSLCISVENNDEPAKFYKLSRTSATENFDLKSFQELKGLNSLGGLMSQPSTSNNMEWVVGVRNSGGYWENNDLFIAHKEFSIDFYEHQQPLNGMVYPNPTTGRITIVCGASDVNVEIFSVMGLQIDRFISSSARVNYQIEEEGVYIIRMFTEHGVQSQKLIVSH